MESAFDFADDLGPVKIIHVHEPRMALRGILVVDNVATGPAIGGLRMAPDVSTAECFRLARAMTLKNAAAGLPHGGGKSVLFGDPKMPVARKEVLIRAFAQALRGEDMYIFGPDMGTDERCMAWVRDEIGRAIGLPRVLGGIPLDEIGATGWGIAQAVAAALPYCGFDLAGARVVVQGFGAVGRHAAHFLVAEGAQLVACADSGGGTHHPEGLDLAALMTHKAGGLGVREFPGGTPVSAEELLAIPCDIWIPAARPDVINESNQHHLATRLVPQGANIPITAAAEDALHRRGVLCLPDFIANAGGVICGALEHRGAAESQVFAVIAEKIRANTEHTLARARNRQIAPRTAAVEMAVERLRAAIALRRFGSFSTAPGRR